MDAKAPPHKDELEDPQEELNPEDNDTETVDKLIGGTTAKVDGEDNVVIAVGGNLHLHYHIGERDRGIPETRWREEIDALKERKKKQAISNTSVSKNEEWLDSLDEFGKYYIVALCFYYGAKVSDFREVLNRIKKYLSIDARNTFSYKHSQIETIEKYNTEKRAITIKLSDDKLVDEILSLVQENHSYLLFNFIPVIKEVVETQARNWELRWQSAVALGQISEIDVEHVFAVAIDPWATSEKAYIRATVGYYYYYFFSAMEFLPDGAQHFLLDKFAFWANPKDFRDNQWRYKWTVAAICEKIGLLEQNQAQKLATQYLEKVAGINHLRVADSVIHAFVEWSLKKNFTDVILSLAKWAEAGSAGDDDEDNPYQIRCVVALLAFSAVIEVHYDILDRQKTKDENIFPVDALRVLQNSKSQDQGVWDSVISVGIRYFDFDLEMRNFFFKMVESWAEIIPDKELFIDFISSWLTEIYLNIRKKAHIENRLKNIWAKRKNKTLQRAAEKIQLKIKEGI